MKRRDAYNQLPGLNAHRIVAQTAVQIAQELFEQYARDNNLYRAMRARGEVSEKDARAHFVGHVAPMLLEDARKALTDLLAQSTTSENVRQQIYDALVADSDLRANRVVSAEEAKLPAYLN